MRRKPITPPARTFAQQLRDARTKAAITQERLAERAGYSLSLVRKFEGGQRRANVRQAAAFADALGLSAAERAALIAAAQATGEGRPQSTLPAPPTPLLGRDAAIAEVQALLRRHPGRVVTLLGPPGVGKTRLALAMATVVEQRFADDVCWVPLASLQSPELLVPTLLRLLGVVAAGSETLLDQLATHLGGRVLLLVLDNCEHLLPAIAPPLALLVERCPQLVVLATSRLPLRVRAEQRYLVPPLALPTPPARQAVRPSDRRTAALGTGTQQFATIAASPAVQLFVERAAAVAPMFALSEANAEEVAAIAAQLDGLPLAIELAAAQMDALPIAELRASLAQRFALFAAGLHDLPDRQRTLHAAIAWSYDLLDSEARMAFARLGVFVGGWTQAASAALGCTAGLDALVHAGLVVVEEGRWRLLETLRAFAVEQLSETALLDDARHAHARFFCVLAEQAEEGLLSRENAHWFAQIDADFDNIRAAIAWGLLGDITLALRISSALYLYWTIRSLVREGLGWRLGMQHTPINNSRKAWLLGKGLAIWSVWQARRCFKRLPLLQ